MNAELGNKPGWLRRTAHIASGVGALGLLLGALVLPMGLPATEPQYLGLEPVEVGSGTTVLVCPPAPQAATAGTATDIDFDEDLGTGSGSLTGEVVVVSAGGVPGGIHTGGLGEEPQPGTAVIRTEAGADAVVTRFAPVAGRAPSVAGVSLSYSTDGDLRGLVAGACIHPSAGGWFVGGDTEVGSSTRLVLTNPGETPVRVRVQAWTGLGEGGSTQELLDPGGSRTVLTESIDRAERIAFHVMAEGGRAAAFLVTSSLEGIVPMGVSQVIAGAPPATDTFVGPLHLEDFGMRGWQTDLRVLNAGTEPAAVSVELLGSDGAEPLAGAEELTIDPGTVSDIPVAAPEPGEYTLRVASSHPIVAGARTVAEGEHSEELAGTPSDVSWLASGQPIEEVMLVNGPGATLAVANPAGDLVEAQLEHLDERGEVIGAETLALMAHQTLAVEVPEGVSALRITGPSLLGSAQYRREGGLIGAVPAIWGGPGGLVTHVVVDN